MISLQMLLLFENIQLYCHYYNSKLCEVEKISNAGEKKKKHQEIVTFTAYHRGNIFSSSLNFTHERILLVIRTEQKKMMAPHSILLLLYII